MKFTGADWPWLILTLTWQELKLKFGKNAPEDTFDIDGNTV